MAWLRRPLRRHLPAGSGCPILPSSSTGPPARGGDGARVLLRNFIITPPSHPTTTAGTAGPISAPQLRVICTQLAGVTDVETARPAPPYSHNTTTRKKNPLTEPPLRVTPSCHSHRREGREHPHGGRPTAPQPSHEQGPKYRRAVFLKKDHPYGACGGYAQGLG